MFNRDSDSDSDTDSKENSDNDEKIAVPSTGALGHPSLPADPPHLGGATVPNEFRALS